ncbi:type II toxin-antitoxin system RelE/ParE family toxin [Terasakiella sp. SH-1]|uniref:type II toxin-antitoxin system RelE/ParE family toxin n=1 Tax=Terasakiella sp. SH-1 TaxID=2560057 RepID=UPI0010735C18|nr:type II toxin-antitoxin system RelE/ParE family toxin [Terasakiella sp. SH-1]
MRVFTSRQFDKWCKQTDITDAKLVKAALEVNEGQYEASLGGMVFKKRIAAVGQGKSGSYRTIIALKIDDKAFFIHGFKKNQKANISSGEKQDLKAAAKVIMQLDESGLKVFRELEVIQ